LPQKRTEPKTLTSHNFVINRQLHGFGYKSHHQAAYMLNELPDSSFFLPPMKYPYFHPPVILFTSPFSR